MSTQPLTAPDTADLAPVADDMSAYVIAGAVASEQVESDWETVSRTPAQGIDDGVEAERLGFRRIWLSERLDIKQADVIVSGIAARTSRLGVGTGVIDPPERHPWVTAALGATMQACYGPRFILGLGRGDEGYFRGTGIHMPTYEYMGDYIDIVRRLWKGEKVTYDGPVGTFDGMSVHETYHGATPPIWFGGYGLPKGAKLIAEHCDGVLLVPMMTPDAVRASVERIREACERIDRDPAEVRISALVVTAPGLDDFETRAIAHGRMVTYMTYPGYGETLCSVNGWDPKVLDDVRNHELFKGLGKVPDLTFHRHQMMEAAACIPDEYMEDCSAFGSVDECAGSLQRFIDAGADEIATYGSTPGQNGKLIAAWRDRSVA